MKNQKAAKVLLPAMMVLSWLTIPLLGKKAIKRYLPASIMMAIIVSLESILARKRKWWRYYVKIHPKLPGGFPLTWGPFLIGSIWILRLTYGRFKWYLLLNLAVDTVFTYKFVNLLKGLRVASLVRLKKYQLSILFFVKSLLLYGFQMIREKVGHIER
ncbi:hypothetical protein ACQCVH_24270 [Bacillus infantis]|uniref:hypothetical protein n=1 Tax=Bacillus infantis TaxID=324767 RepID=UPI003CE72122